MQTAATNVRELYASDGCYCHHIHQPSDGERAPEHLPGAKLNFKTEQAEYTAPLALRGREVEYVGTTLRSG